MPKHRQVGATGQFPLGKLNEHDEGELRLSIAADPIRQVVVLEFGKKVKWIALPAQQVRELAATLIEKADEMERRRI